MRETTVRKKLKRLLPFLCYLCVWLAFFFLLKRRQVERYAVPILPADLKIPYVRFFVIPYLFWFPWLAFVWIFAAWTDASLCRRITFLSMIGRTVYLIVSFVWPTALALRPATLPDSDIFYRLSAAVYGFSEETYVFPSIHVFDSCVALYAVFKAGGICRTTGFRVFAVIVTVLICLSTVLLRQHSILDLAGGMALFFLCMRIPSPCLYVN